MTQITTEQAREVLWASSEEGKAQLRAAWAKAQYLGLVVAVRRADAGRGITMDELGALLWAAHNARPDRPQNPVMTRMLQLITDRGEQGATIRLVAIWLSAEGMTTTRESLHRWAARFEQDGVLERGGAVRGSWRVVKR
jgi:hypothetical protein